jgi:hypothetical protein
LAAASRVSAPGEWRRPGDDHGRRVPAQQRAQLVLFAFERIAGGRDQQLEAGILQPVAEALRGFGEDRVGQVGQQRGHDVADTAGQQAGLLVGHVAGGRQRLADALRGVGRHHRRFAQVARHGDRRDTRGAGHVLQGHTTMAAAGLAGR